MPHNGPRKQNIWMPLLFSSVLVIGMLLGYKLDRSLGSSKTITDLIERNDRIDEIIDLISSRYIDPVNRDSIFNDAIQGIMSHLDPFTFYIPAMQMANTQNNLEGKMKGIGLEYYIHEDTVYVISVIPDGPADKAGIKIGDRIISINNQKVTNIGITNAEVKALVNDENEITTRFDILRNQEARSFNVLKGTVVLPSIDAFYMRTTTAGYIRINRFSATTYQEFMAAMKDLKSQGMKSLILDLRENPGGYVDDAIAILDEFIDGDKTLLTVLSRNDEQIPNSANKAGIFEDGRLVVLVNEGSASASEIVAGAIQDWDRGVILGRKTFGKGLIQEQFELSDGSAIRLTIAKYLTPSGRSIQKKEQKQYLHQQSEDWPLEQELVADKGVDSPCYTLINKRKIETKDGGVMPDNIQELPAYLLDADLWKVINMIDAYTLQYFTAHIDQFTNYDSYRTYFDTYHITKQQLDEFKDHIPVKYIQSVNKVWANPRMLAYIKLKIKANYARLLFRSQGYFKVMNSEDEEVNKAFDIIGSEKYNEILKNNKI